MTSNPRRRARRASVLAAALAIQVLILVPGAPTPARADFFDDVRRTFQTDIPHFFQDDIPCAFGGQPTSHTRTSCKGAEHPAAAHPAAVERPAAAPPAPAQPRVETRTPPEYP